MIRKDAPKALKEAMDMTIEKFSGVAGRQTN